MTDKEWIKRIKEWIFGDDDEEWIKERIKEWIFGIFVGLGFFSLYVVACLSNGGVI